MALYNIPPTGAISKEVDDLRTAREEFAQKRSMLRYMLQNQQELAAATTELLSTIAELFGADYVVPKTISIGTAKYSEQAPETLPGTLPPFVMQHADKLQALANSYGYQICMHPKLTDHGRLYPHWQVAKDCGEAAESSL